jgi:activator of HSP90 ATPase
MTKTLRQTVTLGASPKQVYAALIQEKRHSMFTGEKAVISPKVGGAFSCYGGYLRGFNIDLVPGKRIVQAWRGKEWPAGVFSIVTFALARSAGGRTRLTLTHVGVPASSYNGINKGWRSFYWAPLKAYLKK